MQKTTNVDKKVLEEYSNLINTVAKVEYSRFSKSSHLIDFSELVNIGTVTVYVVLSSQPESNHNNSYISTAIRWAIRNELRRRYKWYSNKHSKDSDTDISSENLREAVYETILSIDEMEQAEVPVQIEDDGLNPDQRVELLELKAAIKGAMQYLSEKEQLVLEEKFYKNKKISEIAKEIGVSTSRISKIVHGALDKIKSRLTKDGII